MNFNTLKNVPNAIYLQSAPARARNSAIVTVILLFLVFAGFVQAAGDAQWNAQTKQVNDSLRQMRRQAQGDPGAMQYVNQAEKLWRQAQQQWALQQRNQQQNTMNQMQAQLLTQQQNLMNQLHKQQEFLQQQLAYLNTPLKKKMDEDSLQRFGRVLKPDMNAKGGPGMAAWEEATRQLASISSTSSSFSTPHAAQSKKPKDKGGSFDNPLPTVQILGKGAPGLSTENSERAAFLEETEGNKYASMSPDELRALSKQYPNNKEIQKATDALLASQKEYSVLSGLSNRATAYEDLSNVEMDKGHKATSLAVAQTVELFTDYPVVFALKVSEGDKVGAVGEAIQYGGSEYMENSMKSLPNLAPYSNWVPFVGKTMLVYDLNKSIPEAYNHYSSGIEPYFYTQSAGGSRTALTTAEKARQRMLLRSQKLNDLIEAQKVLNK